MSVLFIFFLMSLLLLRPLPTDARGWVVIGKLILWLYRAGQSAMTKLGLRGQPRHGDSVHGTLPGSWASWRDLTLNMGRLL